MKICHIDDIQDLHSIGFSLAGFEEKVIVVRKGNNIFGYLDSCPHYEGGTPMAYKKDAYLNGERTHLTCYAHGALFEIDTGECIVGPCLGKSLRKIELHINQSGDIIVDK